MGIAVDSAGKFVRVTRFQDAAFWPPSVAKKSSPAWEPAYTISELEGQAASDWMSAGPSVAGSGMGPLVVVAPWKSDQSLTETTVKKPR